MKKIYTLVLVLISFLSFSQTFTCGDTLLDIRDGQKYPTVLIGSQCWMKKNLNYGNAVTSVTSTTVHYDMFNNSIPEKYPSMGNISNFPVYGGLYEWPELMNYTTVAGGQGLCPTNWHVPTDAEWQTMIIAAGGTLITTAGGYGGNKLKAIGEGVSIGIGTNTSGFTARSAGDRDAFGVYYGIGQRFIFWTSTEVSAGAANHYTLWSENDTIERLLVQKQNGFSCRCVRNAGAGIEEGSLKNQFNVYPNPTNSILNITASDFKGEIKVIVKDLTGREILAVTSKQIDISNLESGLYLIQILNAKTEEQIGVKRIIKN